MIFPPTLASGEEMESRKTVNWQLFHHLSQCNALGRNSLIRRLGVWRARSAKLFFSLGGIPEEGWAVIQDGVDSVNEGNTIKVKQDKCRGGHWCAGNHIMWKSASCPLRALFLVQAAWNQKGCSQGVSWRY